MKIRHVYHQGLIKHPDEEQISKQRQFQTDSFFRQLASRDEFINNSIFVIINVHNRAKIQTIFEWFKRDSCISHVLQFINEYFDFDTSKYVLRNEDNDEICQDTKKVLPNKDRIIFSFEREDSLL